MRILFVCKRHPQQRDLLSRPYGRFHHLPVALAARGHEIRVLLCSHRRLESVCMRAGGVSWTSHDVRTLGLGVFLRRLREDAREFRPDWIIGLSDAHFGWLAQHLSEDTAARLCVDAYDNFEAYMPWNLPLHHMWHRAIRRADLVTAAGPQLAAKMQLHRDAENDVAVLPMAADAAFVPLDRAIARQMLGLPLQAPLVGYIGSWSRNRGTHILLDAYRAARRSRPDLRLVLSGDPPRRAREEPGCIVTGYLADEQLPQLINALDVAAIITANTRFGRYSYPAKLCEAIACGIPVLATSTEPVRWMLKEREHHLVRVGDRDAFARRLVEMLANPRADYGEQPTWESNAELLERLLLTSQPRP